MRNSLTAPFSPALFFTALFCVLSFLFLFAGTARASATEGTIDGTNKWAWSETTGWIDFGTSGGSVRVTDSGLTGYAYGENVGWISLNCSNTSSCGDNNYAVSNDGSGNLSGYAWGSNTGWINFAPTNGGVEISASGVFSGTAYAENIGWIVFGTDHPVTTDWRPSSSRDSGGNGAPIGGPMGFGFVSTANSSPIFSMPWQIPATASQSQVVITPAIAQNKPAFTFTKNRRMGESGEDVKALQIFLNSHDAAVAATGAGSPGNETTYFGARTRAAVAAFQKKHGIEPPAGYFGPLTRAYINSHY